MSKTRSKNLTQDLIDLIRSKGDVGKSPTVISKEIFKEKNVKIATRTIRTHLNQTGLTERIKETITDLVAKEVLKVTLSGEIEQTYTRKQFLLEEAFKIWDNLSPAEKNTSRMFIKMIELAQKDSEMLLRVMSLPDKSIEPTQNDISKSLEEKLGILDDESTELSSGK